MIAIDAHVLPDGRQRAKSEVLLLPNAAQGTLLGPHSELQEITSLCG